MPGTFATESERIEYLSLNYPAKAIELPNIAKY
ncbi:hypothetical protein N473_03795 [Pseudoalteromonas luteoviolacea CPMOR-1]|uniref:Uncharacterized protein n=1 Tax=Pseudoalteromonas luteoviolacea CPMOR-1 TaxID=1365248 RepID=A0A167IF87_9GAMM|nr:hypothetical protein N473_03795 [Pseudoalteromonas luteoviolacea CPMOR-1]